MFEQLINAFNGETTVTAVASNTGAGIQSVLFVLLWVVIIVLGLWFAIYMSGFKHTVLIREVTATRKFIVRDRAKIRVDKKDGVEYWYLRNRKVSLISPEPASIEITKKGRFFAEVYHDLESGKDAGYSWIVDDGDGKFIAYPAEHRALLNARIRRASERKGRSTLDTILTIASIGIPLVALVLVFSFWGDLTKSTTEASQSLQATMKDFSVRVSNFTCQQSLTAQKPVNYASSVPLDQQVSGVGG